MVILIGNKSPAQKESSSKDIRELAELIANMTQAKPKTPKVKANDRTSLKRGIKVDKDEVIDAKKSKKKSAHQKLISAPVNKKAETNFDSESIEEEVVSAGLVAYDQDNYIVSNNKEVNEEDGDEVKEKDDTDNVEESEVKNSKVQEGGIDEVKKDDNNKIKKANKEEKVKRVKEKKELTEIPTIRVKKIKCEVNEFALKQHFAECGKIVSCKIIIDRRTQARLGVIKFTELSEAKSAVNLKKPLMGWQLKVEIVRIADVYTPESTVIVRNIPDGSSKHDLEVRAAMGKFGAINLIKFTQNRKSAYIQFKDKLGVSAALKAGIIPISGNKAKISPYFTSPSSDTKVILYGTEAFTEQDAEAALSIHCTIASIFSPLNNNKINSQLNVELKDKADVEKLLKMKTIKINNKRVDILPNPKSKYFFNQETGTYYRHPGGVFVENIPFGVKYHEVLDIMSEFGIVSQMIRFNKNTAALVTFEKAASAQKALDAGSTMLKRIRVKYHAVDGVYVPQDKPSFSVETTVYCSNILYSELFEVTNKIKEMKLNYIRTIFNKDPITNRYEDGLFVEFSNADAAKKLLDAEIAVDNGHVQFEMYDPVKHDYKPKDGMVFLENLNEELKLPALKECFEKFGEVKGARIFTKCSKSIGCAFVEFADPSNAKKVLKRSTVNINGNKIQIIQPTMESVEKLRRKLKEVYQSTFKKDQTGSVGKFGSKIGSIVKKSTFKKKTFK